MKGFNRRKRMDVFARWACLGMVLWGTISKLDIVWNTADAAMGLMATVNLIGIVALAGVVKRVTVDYLEQVKAGKEPVFNPQEHPEMVHGVDHEIWQSKPAVEGAAA